MPSADFCAAIGLPRGLPSPESGTRHRPPRLSLSTFVARPPDLQPWPSMDGGLRRLRSARPTSTAYYPISVRRAAILLHAAFRRNLTAPPLRFANPSPPSSWIRDLHPQVDKHAWQTEKGPPRADGSQKPDAPSAHPRSGYPSPGCVPAEPDSVSPDTVMLPESILQKHPPSDTRVMPKKIPGAWGLAPTSKENCSRSESKLH